MKDFKLWRHQSQGIEDLRTSYAKGHRRMCFVAPPGAGKSLIMREIILPLLGNGKRVNVYVNRRMLTSQTMTYYAGTGVEFGVIAADHPELRNPNAMLQICSIQTVASRMDKWDFEFPWCDFFLIDERHQMANAQSEKVFQKHIQDGAVEIGFTATPTTMTESNCDDLVTPVDYGELVEIGSHLPVHHYSPDVPDMNFGAEVSEGQSMIANPPAKIVGNVFETWKRLNPFQKPAILFAPSVAASAWYCEEFIRRGVGAAHIDASKIIVSEVHDGELVPVTLASNQENRQRVMDGSQDGSYKVVCNRFVLREAIDMKWLYHGICCTTFSSLSSFLQASGRVLRYTDQHDSVIWQDHGANILRWGFINQDRDWEIGKGNSAHFQERKEKASQAEIGEDGAEPITCPKCDYQRSSGVDCPECGHCHKMTTRKVRAEDGTLKLVRGRFFKKAKTKGVQDFVNNSLYAHRAMCRKNRTMFRTKTLRDIAVNAVTRAEREGIEISVQEAMDALRRRYRGSDEQSNFMGTCFPGEKTP